MKVKQKQGYVVHQPLSYIFQMVERGGSPTQKYDSDTQTWVPNRAVTPYQLQPQLLVTDPENSMPSGDYTSQMTNVTWTLVSYTNGRSRTLTPSDGYSVNAITKALTISRNVETGEILKVSFTSNFTDARRNEVQCFKWSEDITTEAQCTTNVSLDHGMFTSKMNLSPWKRWNQFGIPVQLKNGNEAIADADCQYVWKYYDFDLEQWCSDLENTFFYVSGATSKEIIVDQDYIQDVLLKVEATAYGNPDTTQTFTTRLRRWYGQYEEDVNIANGKYVFHDTNMVVLEAKVVNRVQGNISNAASFFDIELFFGIGSGELESVGYGEEVILHRNDLQDGDPRTGVLVRELSAFVPLALDNGNVLCDDDGKVLTTQVPVSEREV